LELQRHLWIGWLSIWIVKSINFNVWATRISGVWLMCSSPNAVDRGFEAGDQFLLFHRITTSTIVWIVCFQSIHPDRWNFCKTIWTKSWINLPPNLYIISCWTTFLAIFERYISGCCYSVEKQELVSLNT
jgi:hypothetical protein